MLIAIKVVKDGNGDVEEVSSSGNIDHEMTSYSYDIIPGWDVSYEGER